MCACVYLCVYHIWVYHFEITCAVGCITCICYVQMVQTVCVSIVLRSRVRVSYYNVMLIGGVGLYLLAYVCACIYHSRIVSATYVKSTPCV